MREKSEAGHPHETPVAARVAVPRCDLYSAYGYIELDLRGSGGFALPNPTAWRQPMVIAIATTKG